MPEDVGGLVRRAAEEGPELPLVVLGQRVLDPERLESTLHEVRGLRADGVALQGWFAEPAIDGYEWEAGFEAQHGLWDVDRGSRRQLDLLGETLRAERPPEDLSGAVLLGDAPPAGPPTLRSTEER
jgi:hypothetical protein